MKHVVYILECKDGSWYTGYTNNFARRLLMHEQGRGAKYTRGRGPFQVISVFNYESKSEAMQAEHALKKAIEKRKRAIRQREGSRL